MAELTMPKMGDAMEEGTLLRWLKSEGDTIQEEEIIAEIQTEKATIEVPSFETGRLTKILVPEGETVPVGTPIARYEPEGGEKAESGAGGSAAASTVTVDREPVPGASRPVSATPGPANAGSSPEPAGGAGAATLHAEGERVKATPLARKVAAARGIDLGQVQGTGPGGRIVEADVEGAATQRPAEKPAPAATPPPAPKAQPATPGQIRPLTPMRRTIAARLTQSKQTVPHFYLTMEVDMEPLAQFRQQLNALDSNRPKVSFNDLIIKACATAMEKFPAMNSQFTPEGIVQPEGVHIGLAVALEEGLIVPVVRDVDKKSVAAIARDAAALIEKARSGKLQPAEYSGGTFTVSSLGMFGVKSFIAVINPPESAILAVGAGRQVPVVKDGQIVPGTRMDLTLSVDHRAIDGAVAAQFLQELKRLLEAPLLLV